MIDFTLDYHAHILPNCDHGSNSLQVSLKQLEMAGAAGVHTIIATSHFYPDKESAGSFLSRREDSYQQLLPHLGEGLPEVKLGAEVLICSGLDRLDGLERLCRQGTNELLLEMPFYDWPEDLWETLYSLQEREDIQVVLAHVDRYPPDYIDQLAEDGFCLQLNAEGVCSRRKRKKCIQWAKAGYVR